MKGTGGAVVVGCAKWRLVAGRVVVVSAVVVGVAVVVVPTGSCWMVGW
jgi:hypothetical protein